LERIALVSLIIVVGLLLLAAQRYCCEQAACEQTVE